MKFNVKSETSSFKFNGLKSINEPSSFTTRIAFMDIDYEKSPNRKLINDRRVSRNNNKCLSFWTMFHWLLVSYSRDLQFFFRYKNGNSALTLLQRAKQMQQSRSQESNKKFQTQLLQV